MAIEWEAIEGYEGIYDVSNTGLIKSYPRVGSRSSVPRLMCGGLDNHGYRVVSLCKDRKVKTFRIHRLVANAFLPNPKGLREINHIDEDKTNNNVLNLEWCDRAYNVNYGHRTEKTKKPVIQMAMDGVAIAEFDGVRSASFMFGKNAYGRISDVCLGKRKSAYGYKWRFKEVSK